MVVGTDKRRGAAGARAPGARRRDGEAGALVAHDPPARRRLGGPIGGLLAPVRAGARPVVAAARQSRRQRRDDQGGYRPGEPQLATPSCRKRERMASQFRLVTRSDFDGLVCAALLKQLDLLGDIKFVHPKDVQDGKVDIGPGDITTNLPYTPDAHLAFDHHMSETLRVNGRGNGNHVIDPDADSAARLVYEYYGGREQFPGISTEMMEAVDKADAARFSIDEIHEPTGWILLSFLMDPRTGLGRFREFRISNYNLMMELIDACTRLSVDEILELPDVRERVDLYREHHSLAVEQIKRCSTVHDNLVVLDLRDEEVIHPTNRFMIYALFPECNISIHVLWGLKQENTVFATGKSIVDRSSRTNVGELMLEYGGGGHEAAGTCQIDNERAPEVLDELVERVTSDG
jgi:nanoRNase/pAp phosphatase (c-di-AMP/oligoRNAs hydrolase)